jgi:hypothetical protein
MASMSVEWRLTLEVCQMIDSLATHLQQADRNAGPRPPNEFYDIGPLTPPDTVDIKREDLRRHITRLLTYTVIIISLAAVAAVIAAPDRLSALKEILPIIFTGLFSVYGTAIGFYFGQKEKATAR